MRIAACFLLLLVAGCPGAVGPEATAGRATVGEVFARCRAWGASDSLIDTLIIAFESDREAGTTKEQQMTLLFPTCDSPFDLQLQLDCVTCGIAIIDFVYD